MKLGYALLAAAAMAATGSGAASAAVRTEKVEYRIDGKPYVGTLAYDDASTAPAGRAGVLVLPEWWGSNEYAQGRARQLAGLGYVALAADLYGEGKITKDPGEAGQLAGALRGDRKELRKRAEAALETLKKQPQVDPGRVAAIGYCFGGTAALELARAGAPIRTAVSFHGSLDFPEPPRPDARKVPVLVLHGADDPMVPQEQVDKFLAEMKAAGVHVDFQAYPGAVHAFSNPDADGKIPGVKYDAEADRMSWEAMKNHLGKMLRERNQIQEAAPASNP